MWAEGVHSGRHMWLYGIDVFNLWDVLRIVSRERGGKNGKVGRKSEKSHVTHFGTGNRVQEK